MPRNSHRHLYSLLAVVGALWLSTSAAATRPSDDNELPDSLRRGFVWPVVGPANDRSYAHGTLGLVRPSYGRASLYVAWRVMHLPPNALTQESHRRESSWVNGRPVAASGGDEIAAWLQARGEWVKDAPPVAPDYFRQGKIKVAGMGDLDTVSGQCGPDAFAFAARTLKGLVADTTLKDDDRRKWVAGQDAVFARCSWTPGSAPVPALPAPWPANAPQKMKAMHAYQHAAALFYADDFDAALPAFDAIAAVTGHPMRPWATLGAVRSLVRAGVRDAEWDAAVHEAWTERRLRGAAFSAAVAEPAARHRARVDALLKQLDGRVQTAVADPELAPVHAALRYTFRRALVQLAPAAPLAWTMDALDRPDVNPYAVGTLDLFQELYPRVAAERPEGPLASKLRQHEWFDFIVTVQACQDATPASDLATCDREHAHALERWKATKDNAWLLAALMTARQPAEGDLPAAEAARAVPVDRPEWASLHFYAARVFSAQGRAADARSMAQALAASPVVHKRDRVLLDAIVPGLSQVAVAPAAVTDEQVRAEYDRFVKLGPTEYEVRHVLLQTREQAQSALDRIKGGEPFEAVAKAVSADTGSRERGGALGWSLPSHFVDPFAEAMKALAPRGLVEQPVQTRFGWHVLEVTRVRPRVVPPYDQVKERIRETLQRRGTRVS
jgi:hypothetical protein